MSNLNQSIMENPIKASLMLESDIESGKPYQAMHAGSWQVRNSKNQLVVVVPYWWRELGEGIAHGIAESLNRNKRIELPILP